MVDLHSEENAAELLIGRHEKNWVNLIPVIDGGADGRSACSADHATRDEGRHSRRDGDGTAPADSPHGGRGALARGESDLVEVISPFM